MPSIASEPGPTSEDGGAEGSGIQATYRFAFSWEGPYGHAVGLVKDNVPPGLVLDLGCGYGAVGEVLRDAGFEYMGADSDSDAIADVVSRGFEAHVVDLSATDGLAGRIVGLLEGRDVAAILLLDILEHLPDTTAVLSELSELAEFLGEGRSGPVLVTSIPNVAHLDLAAKLVAGRWDVTPSGLLDRTHLQLFTEARVDAELSGSGWAECGRDDVVLEHSDQSFPVDHPYLVDGGPVHEHLRSLRSRAGPNMAVNQFVRAYRFTGVTGVPTASHDTARSGNLASTAPSPFLSVLVRTQGGRPAMLAEALTCLAAQTWGDLEVVVLVHSDEQEAVESCRATVASFETSFCAGVRVEQVPGGGSRGRPLNAGLELAAGRYVAFLDDDDLVTADWAESFAEGAGRAPGKIVRSICYARQVRRAETEELAMGAAPVTLSGLAPEFGERFDAIFHLAVNTTPILSFALPRSLVTELHMSFDEELEVCEDWDLLVRAALLVGVEDTGKVTSIYQRWSDTGTTTAELTSDVWKAAHARMLEKLDSSPLLLPSGIARELANLAGDGGLVKAHEANRVELERLIGEARVALTTAQERLRAELQAGEELRGRLVELEELRGRVTELQERAEGAEKARDELLASDSWRATAPLRAVAGLVKRDKGGTGAS
ncbi:MAG: glycosyltransferase [Acidimicrobiales bacterium]